MHLKLHLDVFMPYSIAAKNAQGFVYIIYIWVVKCCDYMGGKFRTISDIGIVTVCSGGDCERHCDTAS